MNAPEFLTFGCRLNSHDTRIMRSQAEASGLHDATIINTCAVTSEAVRRARQAIRKARRKNPASRIIVTGCAAQSTPDEFARMDEVDLVLGNEEKFMPELFTPAKPANGGAVVNVGDIMQNRHMTTPALQSFGERARAFVQVQTGCDHRCTFCIIPFGRGNARSSLPEHIISQIRNLVERGHNEIVLTGVDITAYGADLSPVLNLGGLVGRILREIPELRRLRLSSIDPVEADAELLRAFAEDERLLPHMHLSLQAGDNLVLKRMKRRHSREDAVSFCRKMRQIRPDMAFGADLIAGFPTETEEMFANTLRLVDECGLSFLHVFPFSARPGTPAAKMPQLGGNVIKERAQRLRDTGEQAKNRFFASLSGTSCEVLVETGTSGHSRQFAPVRLDREMPAGEIVPVEITGSEGDALSGRVIA